MTHTYPITGMTCQSCVQKVKTALESLPQITSATPNLATNTVEIVMSSHIEIPELNQALAKIGNYKIQTAAQPVTAQPSPDLPQKSFKTYWPLILVLSYILLGVAIHQINLGQFHWQSAMTVFMGGFFLFFSFFKILDLRGFAGSYLSYDLITKAFPFYGYLYPFVELALAIAYLTNFQPFYTNLITSIVMFLSLLGVLQAVFTKRQIRCACLGTGFNLPMSTVTIIEDAIMMLMALAMILMN